TVTHQKTYATTPAPAKTLSTTNTARTTQTGRQVCAARPAATPASQRPLYPGPALPGLRSVRRWFTPRSSHAAGPLNMPEPRSQGAVPGEPGLVQGRPPMPGVLSLGQHGH